ncbi:unnamed protein product [Ambrosiozyma monospora]|uniref:Unnamed protein product n=1 Tax=Ambrosiozyma monospora TaxID=43982 RepID=A0ACB5TF38_AMBMO|nr:unnamed protein product [Ambrosiozyma monospora]
MPAQLKEIPLICSIDVGTTSTRAILFTRGGEEITKHQIEYSTSAQQGSKRNSPAIFSNEGVAVNLNDSNIELEEISNSPTLSFPKPGWVECNPGHILANVLICLAAIVTNLEIINSEEPLDNTPKEHIYKIVSIGLANMRETVIIWSKKTGRPLYNGVVWNDTRTLDHVNHLQADTPEDIKDDLKKRTGLL